MAEIDVAKAKVLEALSSFQSAIKDYRRASGSSPTFIMDKQARRLPQKALSGCKVYGHRYDLLDDLPNGGVVAEIGTMHGDFAREILDRNHPKELHLFDLVFQRVRPDVVGDPRVQKFQGESARTMAARPNGTYDWIYIDASHTYEGAKADAMASIPKLKAGGILVFNDYTTWSPMLAEPYGVVAAVNELVGGGGWDVIGIALSPRGYWDIAIKRAT